MRDEILARLEKLKGQGYFNIETTAWLDAAITDIRAILDAPVTVYVGIVTHHTPYVGDTVSIKKVFSTERQAYSWIAEGDDRDFVDVEMEAPSDAR